MNILELRKLLNTGTENVSGVYSIRNIKNNKIYVGRSVNIRLRCNTHVHHLRNGTHTNKFLQRSWYLYGEDCFSFKVEEYVEAVEKLLQTKEQYYIDHYRSYEKANGFNLSPSSVSNLGYKHTEDVKERIKLSNTGKKRTDLCKANIVKSLLGRKQSKETIQKRVKKLKGKTRTLDQSIKRREVFARKFNSKKYEAFNKRMTISDWARCYDINVTTLRNRVVRGGMSMSDALTKNKFKGKRFDLTRVDK